jgi:hypothetical protein
MALVTLAACGTRSTPDAGSLVIDDSTRGQFLNRFAYTGRWQHVSGYSDGRLDGTSSRSTHPGDSVVLTFEGSVVRIFGVRGPNGGDAGIGIDGKYYGTADFYSPKKQTHALVFQSPPLAAGAHTVGVVVKGRTASAHRAYVNIDGAQVLPQQ